MVTTPIPSSTLGVGPHTLGPAPLTAGHYSFGIQALANMPAATTLSYVIERATDGVTFQPILSSSTQGPQTANVRGPFGMSLSWTLSVDVPAGETHQVRMSMVIGGAPWTTGWTLTS